MKKSQLAILIALVAIAGYLYKQSQSRTLSFVSKENSLVTTKDAASSNPKPTTIASTESTQKSSITTPQAHKKGNVESFIIHISGAIQKPGVYAFKRSQALYQIIQAAGGPLKQANLDSLDLSINYAESQKIYIPFMQSSSTKSSVSSNTGLINLNTASVQQLTQLPGIGPKTAAAILHLRKNQGPLKKLKDLEKVKGLGAKKIQKIASLVKF